MTESEIFQVAIKLSIEERAEYLRTVCGDDIPLLKRLEKRFQTHVDLAGTLPELPSKTPSNATDVSSGPELALTTESSDPKLPSDRESGALQRGDELGPFRLLHPLGRGGMGEVWKAEQLHPVKRLVALKVIKRGISSKEVLARFDAERQALALMNHPNIARIVDAGSTPDGQPYFAMELVDGKPLTNYCDENRLGIDERLQLFQDVCMGVQHAHQKGIVHRDLKPGNILVAVYDGKPVAKVIDFGLAKAMESTLKLTEQSLFTGIGQILGTLKYMSPEQAGLDLIDIDTRTDIYSLGVILYELLTGSTPIEESSIKELAALKVLEYVREKEPVKPSSRISSSSGEQISQITGKRKTDNTRLKRVLIGDLDWVVMKALEKDRSRRYQSASGFAADVLRYLNGEPVDARPPSLNYRVKKFVRKNRAGVVSATLVFLALVGGIIGTTVGLLRATKAEEIAEERRKEAEGERTIAESRRIQAEKNLSFAKKGNEILGSVFSNLDPNADYQQVEELRNALRDNLQNAAEQLEGSAIGEPLAVAEMQFTLARSLISLQETESAIQLLEKVRETRLRLLGVEHSDTLRTMNVLAESYLQGGRIDEALDLYEKTWNLTKLHLGQNHSGTLNTMVGFANALLSNGQTEKGVSILEKALEDAKSKFGPNNNSTLTVANNLATAYSEIGRTDKALPLYEQAAATREANLGIDHPHTLMSYANLGWAQIEIGDFESAAKNFKRSLDKQIETLGADNPDTMKSMSGLAAAYEETNQLDKAIELYERVFQVLKLKAGEKHPDTLSSMNNLAGAYYRANQLEKTIEIYIQAIELMKEKFGTEHPVTLLTINNLALAYQDTDQIEKAMPLFDQSLKGLQTLNFKSQFALSMFSQSISSLEESEKYTEADHWRSIWQSFLSKELGEESTPFVAELESHGRSQLKRNNLAEAEKILQRCLSIREKLSPDNWSTFNTKCILGQCLLGQKRYDEAEVQLKAGYLGLKSVEATIPPGTTPGIPGTLGALIELYTATKNDVELNENRELRKAYPAELPSTP